MSNRKKYQNSWEKTKMAKKTYLKTPAIILCLDWFNIEDKYSPPDEE